MRNPAECGTRFKGSSLVAYSCTWVRAGASWSRAQGPCAHSLTEDCINGVSFYMVAKEKTSCIPRFALWTPDGPRGKLVTSLGITWGSFRLVGSELRLMYMTWAVSQDYPHVPWASLLQVCSMGRERDRGFRHQNITSSIFYLQGSQPRSA